MYFLRAILKQCTTNTCLYAETREKIYLFLRISQLYVVCDDTVLSGKEMTMLAAVYFLLSSSPRAEVSAVHIPPLLSLHAINATIALSSLMMFL